MTTAINSIRREIAWRKSQYKNASKERKELITREIKLLKQELRDLAQGSMS